MPEIETTVVEKTEAGSGKADWSALKDFSDVVVKPAETTPAPKNEEKKPEELEVAKPEGEAKPEPTPEEKLKQETEALSKEAKELGLAETATKEEVEAARIAKAETEIQLKVEDIGNVPQTYEEGTFKALAHDLFKIDLADESPEAFQKAFVPRSELEKVQNLTLDSVLASVNPEVATALKLMDMGMPAESVLAPTRELDGYLALDDVALVRADLEAQKDLTQPIIDDMMEKFAESPEKLKLEADKLRIFINRQKTQIVEERKQYLAKYETDKQNAVAHKKEQERAQLNEAMNNVSSFMGVPVSKEVKDALIRKYNSGLYDNDLNNAASKAEYLLYKEFGQKFAKHAQNKASETAKTEVAKKLLNIPPVVTGPGSKVDASRQPTDNPWGAISEDFGKK